MPIEVKFTPSVEPGAYEAVCTDVEVREKDGNEYRRWEFTLADDSGRIVTGNSSMFLTSGSKGGKWLAALIGRTVVDGETVEPVGKACTIVVGVNDNGYPTIESVVTRKASAKSPVKPLTAVEDAPGAETDAAMAIAAGQEDLPF